MILDMGDDSTPEIGEAAVRVACWGARGSVPSPGPDTARVGGNTPCMRVRTSDGQSVIFDAGTGIRGLGRELMASDGPIDTDLFLTHFHWDHIQGIPFFAPIYDARCTLRIHGARQHGVDIQTLFAGQMGPIYFPVPFEALSADLSFAHIVPTPLERDGLTIAAFRMRHPAHTYGYRVDFEGASVAYVPDNELVGASYEVDHPGWRRELLDFIAGVDVLYHDAMYTEEEYPRKVGWGHSTIGQAVELAEEAGAKSLLLFHHAPDRSDEELESRLETQREDADRRGWSVRIELAVEGGETCVPGGEE